MRNEILAHVGRIEQLASIRRYSIEDGKGRGMRAFEVVNSSGFDFTVYPDRGLDIESARYMGKSLVWLNRNGPVAPAFYDGTGIEWLRTWMGGLVTTCGWINVGNPCITDNGSQGLHGRMDHTPAEEVNTRCWWVSDEEYRMEISGKIAHCRVFGENLVTTRTITTVLGKPYVELRDLTENLGATTEPLMQLYHMNFGYPLISERTRLVAMEHKVVARDEASASGLGDWQSMPSPAKDYAEQVLYHYLIADDEGFGSMVIDNPDFGAKVKVLCRLKELPYMMQWRQAGIGDYVMGLEPSNCYPIGQINMKEKEHLRYIEPGEKVETIIRLEIGDSL